MYRFFEAITRPLLEATKPGVVIEVGSDYGHQTELVADWCAAHGAVLHCVDPLPKYEVADWQARWPEAIRFHLALSVDALPQIGHADVVLIDGDHNWYTVKRELELVAAEATRAGKPFPLVLLHDVAWPYGRRDLYYDPSTIPAEFRQEHRKGGLSPDSAEVLEHGFNDHLENAVMERTPRNGVLTGVEDFVKEYPGELRLETIPGIHGLGILLDAAEAERIGETFTEILGSQGLRNVMKAVEADRIGRLQDISKLQRQVARKQGQLAKKQQEFRDLQAHERKMLELRQQQIKAVKAELAQTTKQAHEDVVGAKRLTREREKRIAELKTELDKLRKRRLVRVALKASSVAKPVFKAKARAASARYRLQSRRIAKKYDRPEQFYQHIGQLMRDGVQASFLNALEASEKQLAQVVPAPGQDPLVSIVMPTYNRADLIGKAIQSIVEQSHTKWELFVCDDASTDSTEEVVRAFGDDRITYLKLEKGGAANARNAGLAQAKGALFAYLDSDNIWHSRYLESHVAALGEHPGRHASYSKYVDVIVDGGRMRLKKAADTPFDYEKLSQRNYIDLNSFVHRREMYEQYGGFNTDLVRQQDWDLILKISFLREPLYLNRFLTFYRRNEDWGQITTTQREDMSAPAIIRSSVARYYSEGMPPHSHENTPGLTIVSWDICRNHFSKAYNLAEAMQAPDRVQMLGFRFFDEPIFPPYAGVEHAFETTFLDGGEFPDWAPTFAEAAKSVHGDVVYAVKPRLPSLGVALLANHLHGTPVVLEMNDLESVVTSPKSGQKALRTELSKVDPADPRLLNPYGELWTAIMESLVPKLPLRATHNKNLDDHFGGGAFQMRNLKDDKFFDPDRYDRDAIRARLGFSPADRVILFGGLVRKHKGIFRFAKLVKQAGENYKLLVVGSRETPDLRKLRELGGDQVKILDPVDRNAMAEVNYASDAVILWLDPDVPASHYQMPYS